MVWPLLMSKLTIRNLSAVAFGVVIVAPIARVIVPVFGYDPYTNPICRMDAMAMGARKAFVDLTEKDRDQWLKTPFIGCDGVTKTGQDWVRCGYLTATVVTPPTAGLALEILVKAIRMGAAPPENTLSVARAFPAIEELAKRRIESLPAAAGRA